MAQLMATLGNSVIPAVDRLSDFVALIQGESQRAPNSALLYLEFWLYAARNSDARARLAALDDDAVRSLADLLRSERDHEGIEPLADPERTARVIETLFRGIGLLRVMQPDVVDDELLRTAIEFVARGLGTTGV
jgi:hypothetical protein